MSSHRVTACSDDPGRCRSFSAGHNTHTVQATLAGSEFRGWRDATVDHIDGRLLTLIDTATGDRVDAWHHEPLDPLAHCGMAVRIHPKRALIDIDTNWRSIAVSDPYDANAPRASTATNSRKEQLMRKVAPADSTCTCDARHLELGAYDKTCPAHRPTRNLARPKETMGRDAAGGDNCDLPHRLGSTSGG